MNWIDCVQIIEECKSQRLPLAIKNTLANSQVAKTYVYLVLTKCMEECHDVKLSFYDSKGYYQTFLRQWIGAGGPLSQGPLLYEDELDNNCTISCVCNPSQIKMALDKIDSRELEKFSLGELAGQVSEINVHIDEKNLAEINKGIQKTKIYQSFPSENTQSTQSQNE